MHTLGFELVAAKPKNRDVTELPTRQPMRPQQGVVRAPSTDQRKVRRQIQVKAGHEFDFNNPDDVKAYHDMVNKAQGDFDAANVKLKHDIEHPFHIAGPESVEVDRIPPCDICGDGTPAEYDARLPALGGPSFGGPWGNVCQKHFDAYGPGQLGTGHGQRLVKRASPADFTDCPHCTDVSMFDENHCPTCFGTGFVPKSVERQLRPQMRTAAFYPARSPGNNWAYDKADSIQDAKDAYRRTRTTKTFKLPTNDHPDLAKVPCKRCGKPLSEDVPDVPQSHQGHFLYHNPKTKEVTGHHYSCGWGQTMEDVSKIHSANVHIAVNAEGYYLVSALGGVVAGPFETVTQAHDALPNSFAAAVEYRSGVEDAFWDEYKPEAFPYGSNTVNGSRKAYANAYHKEAMDESDFYGEVTCPKCGSDAEPVDLGASPIRYVCLQGHTFTRGSKSSSVRGLGSKQAVDMHMWDDSSALTHLHNAGDHAKHPMDDCPLCRTRTSAWHVAEGYAAETSYEEGGASGQPANGKVYDHSWYPTYDQFGANSEQNPAD